MMGRSWLSRNNAMFFNNLAVSELKLNEFNFPCDDLIYLYLNFITNIGFLCSIIQ